MPQFSRRLLAKIHGLHVDGAALRQGGLAAVITLLVAWLTQAV